VVIPCHNYGRYLAEAIESVRRQTLQPVDVVVIDDASTDNTREVAEAAGVRCISIDAGQTHIARRTGYDATESDLICFLDADDVLPPDYLEAAAAMFAADWQLGIAYSDFERFGDESGLSNFPHEHKPDRFGRVNYIHAGSVVRRSALRISDAFSREYPDGAHDDYILWRRVLDHGWRARKSTAIYRYRRHGESQINRRAHLSEYDRLGLCQVDVSIVIPLAGRHDEWGQLSSWLERQLWPREQCRLLLCDTSRDAAFSLRVRDWIACGHYQDVRHIVTSVGPRGLADEPRHLRPYLVQDAVLRAWRRLTAGLDTPWALMVEDDVIPPDDAIEHLLCTVTGSADAVALPYISRSRDHWVVFRSGRSVLIGDAGDGVEHVDGAGCGCLLIRSHIIRDHVWTHGPRQSDWYDPWLARAHGLRVLCDWRRPARHLAAE